MRLFRGFMSQAKYNLKYLPVVEKFNQLTIELNSDTVAAISYVKVNDQTYDLVHTLIPEQLQGQGLGHLFAEVCEFLVPRNCTIFVLCKHVCIASL